MSDASAKKEITVKRVSAFKFEIEVSVGVANTEVTTAAETSSSSTKPASAPVTPSSPTPNIIQNRLSVIRKAPPSSVSAARHAIPERRTAVDGCVRAVCPIVGRRQQQQQHQHHQQTPTSALLIGDAILYRIIEILLWRVLGEDFLSYWGYPTTPTYKLLWRIVHYYSCFHSETRGIAVSLHKEEHDCQGDINCFMDHVGHFLDLCAPTPEIKERFGWSMLTREEILKKIYFEDLLPFLSKSDLRNNVNILNSHRDILRLQKWQEQGFTAISWNGHEHFSSLKSRIPWCPQCGQRWKKSIISY